VEHPGPEPGGDRRVEEHPGLASGTSLRRRRGSHPHE
jgi:hypothetical protein